jgi:hypothetical protein
LQFFNKEHTDSITVTRLARSFEDLN